MKDKNKITYILLGGKMKKIFSFIGFITIIYISFIISNKTATVVKDIDGLLAELKEIKIKYEKQPEDAIIQNNKMIPGLYGKKLNIEKTYKELKKIGTINEKYFIYEQIKPKITTENQYDKYIISGNKAKNMVSIIIIVQENDNIEQMQKTLKNIDTKVNFFIDNNTLNQENVNVINKEYCYTEEENEEYLKKCAMKKKYTIIPTIIIKTNPMLKIKKQIKSGSIIALRINDTTIDQLELLINYINSKGYKIETLKKHLSEKEI